MCIELSGTKIRHNFCNHQPGETINNSGRDRVLCLYVLEYFFHDFLFWFHNETKIGSIERLGEPVRRVKYVSITIQKRPVANCILPIIKDTFTLLIMAEGGGGSKTISC